MTSLALQESTKIALDQEMRGYWLVRTLALTEQEISGIRIIMQGNTDLSTSADDRFDASRLNAHHISVCVCLSVIDAVFTRNGSVPNGRR